MALDVSLEAVKRKVWIDYQYSSKDRMNDLLDAMQQFASVLKNPSVDLKKALQEGADLVHDRLWIKDVTIGLKDPKTGKFRYEVMKGLKPSTWDAHKKISYTYEQFSDVNIYKPKDISKFTKLFLSEDNPYADGEEETYERPIMLKSKRRSLEDSIEGDYLDIHILGNGDELLGWIEISGTVTNKIPDTATIKTIELLASLIGVALSHVYARTGARA
jgi:hypothetical protein